MEVDKMIVKWIVKCDSCGKEIDATQESFRETENGQYCEKCYEEN